MTFYRPRPIKRRRRTADQVRRLHDQIISVLAEDHPQSVRHVFYRMTNPRLPEPVDKTDQGYNQVQNHLTKLRRAGRVPYGWITDATRRGYHVATYSNASDFIQRVKGLYRGDLWRHADHYCEVWCESRSIAGVIEGVCEELAVSLYPAGGFTSLSLAYQAAEHINAATGDGIPAEILYVGDYDPAGILIEQSIEAELRQHLDPDVDLTFHRVGITKEQIEEYDLPTKPRNKNEKRLLDIERTVEAEAMPARILRDLLRDEIENFLPADALRVTKAAEESERDLLNYLVDVADSEARP